MTVAALGFAIDSSQAAKASSDLDKLTAASSKAEAASEKLSRATKSVDLSKLEAGVGSTNSSLQKLIDLAEQTNVALSKLSRAPAPRLPAAPKIDPKPIVEAGKAAALTSQQMLNLSRQGNDVLTMFAMGAPPMQIFASQAGQIYGALEEGPGGLRGSLRAVGDALLGLITRFPLATAAMAAAGAAVVAYKLFGGQEIKSLDDVLKQHKAAIDSLGPAYHGVLKETENYATRGTDVINRVLKINKEDAKKALKAEVQEVLDEVQAAMMKEGVDTGGLIGASRFQPFMQAIEALRNEKSTVREFQAEVERLGASSASIRPVADELIRMTAEVANSEIAVHGMVSEVSEAQQAFANLKAAIGVMDTGPAKTELEALRDKIIAGEASVKDITTALTNLSQARPDLSAAIAEIKRLALAAWGASDAVNSVRLSPGGPVGGRVYNKFNELLPGGKGDTRAIPTPSVRVDPYFDDPAPKKGRSAADKAADAYKQLIKSTDDRIKQMRTELEYVGQVGVEVDALKNYQELLAKATDRGRTVGEAQQKELRQRAEDMAKLKAAMAAAKLQQDLLFEREQMGRSSTDQLVADTLRSAGLKVDFSSAEAGAIRMNEELRRTRELLEGIAEDITSGLKDALADGKLEWRELGDIAMSVLSRIADQLIQMATDQLIASLMKTITGAMGGGVGSLPGGVTAGGVGLWAKGGVFNAGNVIPFARGGVVSGPTMFPMRNGAGLMGEAGPEAIMPLRRGSDGRLGVAASGAANTNINPSFMFAPVVQASGNRETDTALVKDLEQMLDRQFTPRVLRALKDIKRRGLAA